MRTTWEKIFHHTGTFYGHDIINELQNKMKVFIPKPEYTEDLLSKHKQHVGLINLQIARLIETSKSKKVMLNQSL